MIIMAKIPYHDWPNCPVYDVFNLLSKRGVMLILKSMGEWHHQFCQIKSSCYNLNNKSLADKLQEMIEFGLIDKRKTDESRYESYYLTDRGESLAKIIWQVVQWSS